MTFKVRDVLEEGLYRTFTRNGLVLLGAIFAVNVVTSIGWSSLIYEEAVALFDEFFAEFPELAEAIDDPADLFPLAVDIPDPIALGIVVVGVLFSVMLLAIAVRVFHSDLESSIPTELVFDNIAWVAVNLFVGSIIFAILWTVGLVLLILPGIFVFVTLIYFVAVVSVEDRSFIDGMSRSWRLTKGHRIGVFLLFLAYFVIAFGVSIAFGMVNSFIYLLSPIAGQLVELFSQSLLMVFFAAILAISYRALSAPPEPDEPTADDDPFEEFIPAEPTAQW